MGKTYIKIKDGPYGEFEATGFQIGIDTYTGGKPMFCVVAYDANHGLSKNIFGSCSLTNVLSKLTEYSEKLAKAIEQDVVAKWKLENEIEE